MITRDDFITSLQLLNDLLLADDRFTKEEQEYLNHTMDQMKFTPEERETVSEKMPEEERATALQNFTPALLGGLFQTLIKGACIDQEIHTKERDFINRLGKAVGLSDRGVEYLWSKTISEMDKEK